MANGHPTPPAFPAVNPIAITEPTPKKRRSRKPKGELRRWEIHMYGGRISGFSAENEEAAREEFRKIVPAEFRGRCELKEGK